MSRVTDALVVLFRRAESSLTLEELDEMSDLADLAGDEAQGLARVCENLAGIVLSDGGPEGPGAGNFQESDSVAHLLCHIAHDLDVISGLIEVGQSAKNRAQVLRRKEVIE
jgi:hypothetical protein